MNLEDDHSEVKRIKCLLATIIATAIYDAQGRVIGNKSSKVANKWLFDDDCDSTVTFPWICEQLDLEPDSLRKEIKKYLTENPQKGDERSPTYHRMYKIMTDSEQEYSCQSFRNGRRSTPY